MTPRERGQLGGKATLEKHGTHHFAVIGTSGFIALLTVRFGGDEERCREHLRQLGRRGGQSRVTKLCEKDAA